MSSHRLVPSVQATVNVVIDRRNHPWAAGPRERRVQQWRLIEGLDRRRPDNLTLFGR